MRYRIVKRVRQQGQGRDALAESLRRAATTLKGWSGLASPIPQELSDAEGIQRENEELRRENTELLEINTSLRNVIDRLQADSAVIAEKRAELEIKLSSLEKSIAANELARAEFEPFWALATSEARLLLLSVHYCGPIQLAEVAKGSGDNVEIIESVCRLRFAGLIRFEQARILLTATGETFLKHLNLTK